MRHEVCAAHRLPQPIEKPKTKPNTNPIFANCGNVSLNQKYKFVYGDIKARIRPARRDKAIWGRQNDWWNALTFNLATIWKGIDECMYL